MKTRRIIGLSVVATAVIWFQVAGRFEASRIEQQRESRAAAQAQAASLRIDSERLMAAVTTLADPKFEGRAAGSPGGIAARAWVVERFKSHRPAAGVGRLRASVHLHAHDDERRAGWRGRQRARACASAPIRSCRIFVVSAHYDHLGVRDGVDLSRRRRQRVGRRGDAGAGGVSARRRRSAARSCSRRSTPRSAGCRARGRSWSSRRCRRIASRSTSTSTW